MTALLLPKPMVGTRSIFLKAQDRTDEDFALASVAASVSVSDGVATRANVILGGVAPTPYRAQEAEDYLLDKPVKDCGTRRRLQSLPSATPVHCGITGSR